MQTDNKEEEKIIKLNIVNNEPPHITDEEIDELVSEVSEKKLIKITTEDFPVINESHFDCDYINNKTSLLESNREKEVEFHHSAIADGFYASQVQKINHFLDVATCCSDAYDEEILKNRKRIKGMKELLPLSEEEGLPWTLFDKIKIIQLIIAIIIIVSFSIITLGGLVLDSEIELFDNKPWLAYGLGFFSMLLGFIMELFHYHSEESEKEKIYKISKILAMSTFSLWGPSVIILFGPNIGSSSATLGGYDDSNTGLLKDIIFSYLFMGSQFFLEAFTTSSFMIAIERKVVSHKPIRAVKNTEYQQLKRLIKQYTNRKAKIKNYIAIYSGKKEEIYHTKAVFTAVAVNKYREAKGIIETKKLRALEIQDELAELGV